MILRLLAHTFADSNESLLMSFHMASFVACLKVHAGYYFCGLLVNSCILVVGPVRSTRLQHRPQNRMVQTALHQIPATGTCLIHLPGAQDSSRLVLRQRRVLMLPTDVCSNRSILIALLPHHYHCLHLSRGACHPQSFR
jgi:hypothetical protein